MKNTSNIFLLKKGDTYEHIEAASLPKVVEVAANECFDLVFIQREKEIDLKVVLSAPEASCLIRGVYLGAGMDNLSLKIDVNHASHHTHSNQIVRGVLTDKAKAAFAGVIHMPKNSQKCSGNQNHRAVLLSDKAQVQATPELEIYADDVVCSHGSAVGPLDKNHLFYLLSRGIDEKTAYQMLLIAFACDIVPLEFQGVLEGWFHEHL